MEIFAIMYFSRMVLKSRKSRVIDAREKYTFYSTFSAQIGETFWEYTSSTPVLVGYGKYLKDGSSYFEAETETKQIKK